MHLPINNRWAVQVGQIVQFWYPNAHGQSTARTGTVERVDTGPHGPYAVALTPQGYRSFLINKMENFTALEKA